ncbi:hypothetical protein RI138_00130 [Streptomyces sp. C11-1]|uniref:Uncharacterized protein n=1 Tax=Streptomyces durocortorensis TaxID=2811104 RepID=A0ABY9VN28_9ACTN|nr:hypothetical protein [Streptomyces durocortorensis]WNF25332.1 hypothetical protein RI138_00130 [Streptomyces durocortorensis]
MPGTLLRDYTDDVDGVRVSYFVTALRQTIISGRGAFSAGQIDLAA